MVLVVRYLWRIEFEHLKILLDNINIRLKPLQRIYRMLLPRISQRLRLLNLRHNIRLCLNLLCKAAKTLRIEAYERYFVCGLKLTSD